MNQPCKWVESKKNSIVSHLYKLKTDSKYRKLHNSVVISGLKLIQEIATRLPIKTLISTAPLTTPGFTTPVCYLTTQAIIKHLSQQPSPDGYIAEVQYPETSDLSDKDRLVILDRIQDPANLGLIIRTFYCLGYDGVILLGGCCSIANDKAIHASKGASLLMPFDTWSYLELLDWKQRKERKLLAADMNGTPIQTFTPSQQIALILGNEGQGIDPMLLDECETLSIPMEKEFDSLNVAIAGGILGHYLRQSYER